MFTVDSRTEKFLTNIGVKYNYSNDLKFDQLSPNWDSHNCGRSQVKIADAVSQYGALMDAGSAAPGPILWLDPRAGFYEVLDGLQRLLAAESRKPVAFSGYVINTDSSAMVKKIRVFANYRLQGGHQESAEWTLGTAVELLINAQLMSIEEVADMGGWQPRAVREKKRLMEFGHAIRGVGGPEKLPDSVLKLVADKADLKDFAEAPASTASFCSDIKRMRLSAVEAEPYVENFFQVARSKGKLFGQFAKKLEAFRSDEDVTARLADPSRRRYQALTAEGRLHRAMKAALTTAVRIVEGDECIPEMAEYFQLNAQMNKVLKQIQALSRKR